MDILGKNRRKTLQDLGLSKKLLDLTPEVQSLRGKTDTLNLLKNLKICSAKDPVKKTKRQGTDWGNIFANDIYDKELVSRA